MRLETGAARKPVPVPPSILPGPPLLLPHLFAGYLYSFILKKFNPRQQSSTHSNPRQTLQHLYKAPLRLQVFHMTLLL